MSSITGRSVRDNRTLYGAQRYEAWWQRVHAAIDHSYVSRGIERRRFERADPTDVDAIGFSPQTKELLLVEFKANVQQFLGNIGQSNALRRTAQLPGVRARVAGEPTGRPQDDYDPDTHIPFGTVERDARYGSITLRRLAEEFVRLRAGEDLPERDLPQDGGRGLEVISAWWPGDLPAAAAPHHIGATFQVGFGNARSYHLFIEFVSDLDDRPEMNSDKQEMFAHLATLPNVTCVVAQDPHYGNPVGKGERYGREEPMPFTATAGYTSGRHDGSVGDFNDWIHRWMLDADLAR